VAPISVIYYPLESNKNVIPAYAGMTFVRKLPIPASKSPSRAAHQTSGQNMRSLSRRGFLQTALLSLAARPMLCQRIPQYQTSSPTDIFAGFYPAQSVKVNYNGDVLTGRSLAFDSRYTTLKNWQSYKERRGDFRELIEKNYALNPGAHLIHDLVDVLKLVEDKFFVMMMVNGVVNTMLAEDKIRVRTHWITANT
jgi:hypothetical protein